MASARANADVPLASRGARLGASFVDLFAYLGALLPGIFMMAVASPGSGADDAQMGVAVLLFAVGFFGLLAYQIYLLVKRGQTIGKRAVGIRIVDHQTEEVPTWGRVVLVRQFLPGVIGSLPYLGWLFAFADVLFIFRRNRRCIHDLMAGTQVITGQPEGVAPREPQSSGSPAPPVA